MFPPPDEAATAALSPLLLVACTACGLVQSAGDGPEEFDDPDAPPPTSSATIAAHARGFVDELIVQGLASIDRRVLELASHRGYLRPFFAEAGITTTVLAPGPTEARRLAEDGARVMEWPGFGRGTPVAPQDAEEMDVDSFDLIVDHYLLSHLDRPRTAIAALARMLGPGGALVLETDHLLSIVEETQFDAVRHGHRSYLALSWLIRELANVGLSVCDARIEPVYGGALRLWARPGAPPDEIDRDGRIAAITARERAAGLDTAGGLAGFAASVDRVRSAVRGHLEASRSTGRHVVGYGAPARAVTFLNATEIGPELLSVTADRAPSKQGRVIPGVRLPIVAPDQLRDYLPGDVLVLAWDLADEIRTAMPWVEEEGGRWLVGLPDLAIVGENGKRGALA